MQVSHVALPSHNHRLRSILLGIGDGGFLLAVGRGVVHRVGFEVRYRRIVYRNTVQARRHRGYSLKGNRIGITTTLFRLNSDSGYTLRIRSGDGHLLTRGFVHRDSRTNLVLQLDGVLQVLFVKALQRVAVQVNHIQIRIGGSANDEVNDINALCTALRRNGDDLLLAFKHAQHTLARFAFGEGDNRDRAHSFAFWQRIEIVQRIGIEARERRTVKINHLQAVIARGLQHEMDDISAAGTSLRTNGNLIIAAQALDITHRSRL